MLVTSADVKDLKEPVPGQGTGAAPAAPTYVLAPGATKIPCEIETAINSDVEGYLTAKVSSNVYDTATGRHLLVPQGSTILGHDQSSVLLYGNERLPTVSLTLALPDGRSVELGHAPITDQQGVAGLTGAVNNHWGRLFGAILIGGALRGGQQAIQAGMAQAGGAGQVASGVASVGSQAGMQRAGRALDTRPTITVESGQLCNVLLIKELKLPALWQ
jgi:type IV secretion system protein VirB10